MKLKLIMTGFLVMLLAACESPYQGGYYNPQIDARNRQMTGALVGAAAGALIGSAVAGSYGGYNRVPYGYGGYRVPYGYRGYRAPYPRVYHPRHCY